MTLEVSQTPIHNEDGDGSKVKFSFDFEVLDSDDINVYKRSTSNDDDYEKVDKDDSTEGYSVEILTNRTGSVTFNNAPLSTDQISIRREIVINQPIDFRSQGKFSPESHEDGMDRLAMISQQINRAMEKSVRIPEYTTEDFNATLPTDISDSDNANKVLITNSDASGLKLGPTTQDLETLAGIADEIENVGGKIQEIENVEEKLTEIENVEGKLQEIENVEEKLQEIENVEEKLQKIENLEGKLTEIENVEGKLAEIENVEGKLTEIENVEGKLTEVEGVYLIRNNVNNVNSIRNHIISLLGVKTEIESLNEAKEEIESLDEIKEEIESLDGIKEKIESLYEVRADIEAAAENAQLKEDLEETSPSPGTDHIGSESKTLELTGDPSVESDVFFGSKSTGHTVSSFLNRYKEDREDIFNTIPTFKLFGINPHRSEPSSSVKAGNSTALQDLIDLYQNSYVIIPPGKYWFNSSDTLSDQDNVKFVSFGHVEINGYDLAINGLVPLHHGPPRFVDTISDMRAIKDIEEGDLVYVKDFSGTNTDNSGGMFIYDPADTSATTDLIQSSSVSGINGRYKAINDNLINYGRYGRSDSGDPLMVCAKTGIGTNFLERKPRLPLDISNEAQSVGFTAGANPDLNIVFESITSDQGSGFTIGFVSAYQESPSDYRNIINGTFGTKRKLGEGSTNEHGDASFVFSLTKNLSLIKVLEIDHNGNVLPGTDNSQDLGSSAMRWDDIYATNGTVQTSDERQKEDISSLYIGLDFIRHLNPVSFTWKDEEEVVTERDVKRVKTKIVEVERDRVEEEIIDGRIVRRIVTDTIPVKEPVLEDVDIYDRNGNIVGTEARPIYETVTEREVRPERNFTRRHMGLLAQELERSLELMGIPKESFGALVKAEDGTYGIRYTELVAPLIRAVQELSQRVIILENMIGQGMPPTPPQPPQGKQP